MSDNASTGPPYQCVLCNGLLQEDISQNLICRVCEAFYPTIDGVRILVMNPEGLLSAHARQLPSESRDQNDPFAFLECAQISAESLSIMVRSREGVRANGMLASEFYQPVYKYLSQQKSGEGVISLLTSYPSGEPFHYYTPYFYRDWYGTEEAEFVNALFTDAIKKYCDGGEQVAVLGCGACGLLHSVSKFFRQSFAVDLSVPALLVANHLLRGGQIDLSINLPHDRFPKVQQVVRLNGATEAQGDINLIAANINNLPFPSSSLSCVATQYVMDAVSNQRLLASEIHRVLADDGIWINFGIPVGATTSDTATHLDLPWFLDRVGFDALETSLQRYKHLDYSALSDWRTTIVHNNIFFVAKKNPSQIHQHPDHFADYFAAKSKSILDKALRLSSELRISVSRGKEFSAGGISEKNYVRVFAMGGELLNMEIPIEAVIFLDKFLHSIDGKRSVAEINDSLVTSFGPVVKEREIIMALKSLRDAALIEIA